MASLFIIKFGSDWMKIVEVDFDIFALIWFHVNEKRKKKNLKSEDFEKKKKKKKKHLEIWWIGSCPQILSWIHEAVHRRTTDGTTTDSCDTRVAMRTSDRAKNNIYVFPVSLRQIAVCFAYMTSHFGVTDHLKKYALNDPK